MEAQKKLARRVTSLRLRSGMTQEELAEASGLTVEAVSRIERSERAPRLGTLEKLAAGLELTLSELFDFDERAPHRAYRPDVRRIAELLADQPRPKLRLIAKIADVVARDAPRR
jgi:transcriptional regulator with XRE-family HTH domain